MKNRNDVLIVKEKSRKGIFPTRFLNAEFIDV